MIRNTAPTKYSLQASLAYFVALAPLVNLVALFQGNQSLLLYIAQGFAFFYILITPGLFLLPFLANKKFPFALGITMSMALSILTLMLTGLFVNTVLPFFKMDAPLTTLPLLIAFDVVIFTLFILNSQHKTDLAFHAPHFNKSSLSIVIVALLLPILACLGAISLNNGGSDIFTMAALFIIFLLIPILILSNKYLDEETFPVALYLMAVSLLLMNSMRGWFITGHDILLEYHVFILTNNLHFWKMATYQDAYNACLSLTILPTYFQNLVHISDAYVFKLLFQFIGASPVVLVYYLVKRYTSNIWGFLAGFLYVSFPSFMVDSAFLNRQNIGFLFFDAMILVLLTAEYFSGRTRTFVLFLLGTGMILSHYSTSYIAVVILIMAYALNQFLRLIIRTKKYQGANLLTLPFVIGLLFIVFLWSGVITKTSNNITTTLKQIATTIQHPKGLDSYLGAAQYSLLQTKSPTPQELFNGFVQENMQIKVNSSTQSNYYPASTIESYPEFSVNEPLIPITSIGSKIQAIFHINLANIYSDIKQAYAKFFQVLLLIGLIGLAIGYAFKENLSSDVPREYIALSLAGIILIIGQTVLPNDDIDYGLQRLFQQNLILLALPIILGLLWLISLIIRNRTAQKLILSGVLLFFFVVLSGFLPQMTGGGRPPLPLDNYGFYYDAYYTHAQEISSIDWLARFRNVTVPVQSDIYFSNVKLLTYGGIAPLQEGLLTQTIEKNSYVYLNFNNVTSQTVIQDINGSVFFYHFPLDFLENNKNLIYNDGESEIYR